MDNDFTLSGAVFLIASGAVIIPLGQIAQSVNSIWAGAAIIPGAVAMLSGVVMAIISILGLLKN